jgi:hypothetical protein
MQRGAYQRACTSLDTAFLWTKSTVLVCELNPSRSAAAADMTAHATRRRLSTLTDGGSPATAIIAPRLLARGVLLRSLSLSLSAQLSWPSFLVSFPWRSRSRVFIDARPCRVSSLSRSFNQLDPHPPVMHHIRIHTGRHMLFRSHISVFSPILAWLDLQAWKLIYCLVFLFQDSQLFTDSL